MNGAFCVDKCSRLPILKWLAKKGLFPTKLTKVSLDVFKWLEKKIIVNISVFSSLAKGSCLEVLDYYIERNYPYKSSILPKLIKRTDLNVKVLLCFIEKLYAKYGKKFIEGTSFRNYLTAPYEIMKFLIPLFPEIEFSQSNLDSLFEIMQNFGVRIVDLSEEGIRLYKNETPYFSLTRIASCNKELLEKVVNEPHFIRSGTIEFIGTGSSEDMDMIELLQKHRLSFDFTERTKTPLNLLVKNKELFYNDRLYRRICQRAIEEGNNEILKEIRASPGKIIDFFVISGIKASDETIVKLARYLICNCKSDQTDDILRLFSKYRISACLFLSELKKQDCVYNKKELIKRIPGCKLFIQEKL